MKRGLIWAAVIIGVLGVLSLYQYYWNSDPEAATETKGSTLSDDSDIITDERFVDSSLFTNASDHYEETMWMPPRRTSRPETGCARELSVAAPGKRLEILIDISAA